MDIRNFLKKIHEVVSLEDSHEEETESTEWGVTSNQRRSGLNKNVTVIWKQLAEANVPANKLLLRWRCQWSLKVYCYSHGLHHGDMQEEEF